MKTGEYVKLDALALADLVRQKSVRPAELLTAARARAAEVEPSIHALVHDMADSAAAAIDAGLPEGPFTGVPFLVKDFVISLKDEPTKAGSRLMAGFAPDRDSELMARYRRAGLVTFAKTSTPEFGFGGHCEAVAYGEPTRNPWALDRSPGGSSGGSAAAVAAGIVPVAHANDGGGSIRIPAACCGLFGLKPSRGRVPLGPGLGTSMAGLPVEHVVSRTVRDSAALLDATSGPDIGAPYWLPAPEGSFRAAVGEKPKALRIAVSEDFNGAFKVDPACRQAVREAAQLLEDLGHHVDEAHPPLDADAFVDAWFVEMVTFMAFVAEAVAGATGREIGPDTVEPVTLSAIETGLRLPATRAVAAEMTLNTISRDYGRFFADYDFLLTPTLSEPAPEIGRINQNVPGLDALSYLKDGLFALAPFCGPFNATGGAAMSLPLYWTEDDRPVGIQLGGNIGSERALLQLAGQLETARPWAHRYPAQP